MIHELKTLPEYFQAASAGTKTFEIRRADRPYALGDVLILKEHVPGGLEHRGYYTGQAIRRIVTYLVRGGQFGLSPDFVVMGMITPRGED